MARSRKKHPVQTDYSKVKWFYKRQAAKKVRKHKGFIPDGAAYKRLYCSWNITDWRWWITADSDGEIQHWGFGRTSKDVQKALRK